MAIPNQTAAPPDQNQHRQRRLSGGEMLATLLGMIVIAIVLTTIVTELKKEANPTPEFHVSALDVSFFKITRNNFSANWALSFLVKNARDDLRISYEKINAFISYQNTPLTSTSICPFYQDEKDQRFLNMSLDTHALNVDEAVAREIGLHWQVGVVNFGIHVNGTLRTNSVYEGDREIFQVLCDDVPVGLSSNATEAGALVGGSRKCRLKTKYK